VQERAKACVCSLWKCGLKSNVALAPSLINRRVCSCKAFKAGVVVRQNNMASEWGWCGKGETTQKTNFQGQKRKREC
jgi:hypothetical protein